jgi:hypothetical protein
LKLLAYFIFEVSHPFRFHFLFLELNRILLCKLTPTNSFPILGLSPSRFSFFRAQLPFAQFDDEVFETPPEFAFGDAAMSPLSFASFFPSAFEFSLIAFFHIPQKFVALIQL